MQSDRVPIMSGNHHQQRRIERMAVSLAEQLCRHYPKGPPDDAKQKSRHEAVLKQWLGQLMDENGCISSSCYKDANEALTSVEYQEVQKAIPIAIARWKSQYSVVPTTSNINNCNTDNNNDENNNSKKEPVKKSFSLLDQLQGGLLANFVAVEDIVEAPSSTSRLILLQKVSHVDDMLLDWNQVLPLLHQGLTGMMDDDNNGSNDRNNVEQDDDSKRTAETISLEYLQLHRTWFDQGRSSTEHIGLQYDLCRNVKVAIQARMVVLLTPTLATTTTTTSTTPSAMNWDKDNLLLHLVQTWHDMWLDIMQRGLYSEDAAKDMEIAMCLWMCDMILVENTNSSSSSISSSVPGLCSFPSHIIMTLLDPQSLWFHSWTNLVSTQRLVDLLQHTGVLPVIVQRGAVPPPPITSFPNAMPSSSSPSSTSPAISSQRSIAGSSERTFQVLNHALYLHSLATLRAILVRTRVSQFPWHLLVPVDSSECESPSVISISDLVDTAAQIGAAMDAKDDSEATASTKAPGLTNLPPTKNQLDELLNIFLTALPFLTSRGRMMGFGDDDTVDWWIDLCWDAIETILWGCKRKNEDFDMAPIKARLSSIQNNMTIGSPHIIDAFCRSIDRIS